MKRFIFLLILFISPQAFSAWNYGYGVGLGEAAFASCSVWANNANSNGGPNIHACQSSSHPSGDLYWTGVIWNTDADGDPCNPGNSLVGTTTECAPSPPEECMEAAMEQGYDAKYEQNEGGSLCTISDNLDDSDCGVNVGTACYSNEPGPDKNCGTVNGQTVCVTSVEGQDVGSSSSSPGSTSQTSAPSDSVTVVEDPTNNTTTTTTTTSTTTTTTTTTSTASGGSDIPDGASMDAGAGSVAPHTCEDGRLASGPISCDSSVACPPDFYLDYGVCIPLPTYTETTETTETTTTTTTVDNTTGQETTTTSSSTSNTPVQGNTGGATRIESDILQGPCDPSEPDYLECTAVESSMPEHFDPLVEGDTSQGFFNRLNNAPIVLAMSSVGNVIPEGQGQCAALSIDLSSTLINQTVSTSLHCEIALDIAPIISGIMIVVWLLLAFRLFGTA